MDQFLRKNLWLINLVSLALLAFFLASGTGALLSLLVAPIPADDGPALAAPRPAKAKTERFTPRTGRDICVANVFDFTTRPCAEEFVEPEEDEEEEEGEGIPAYCAGGATLVATMVSTDPSWSFAMIKSENVTNPYRVGKSIPQLGTVSRVGWRMVLVDADSGPDCLLDLYPVPNQENQPTSNYTPTSTPVASAAPVRPTAGRMPADLEKQIESGIEVVSATERNVDRALVDSLTENSAALMSQARILPYEQGGQVQGFKLYGIRRNSLLGRLGLRNGDIVNSIGGIDMTSPDRALEAYTKLRNADHLTVTYTRRGRRETMDYSIR
jgi:general secretion pathway protein C